MSSTWCKPVKEKRRSLLPGPKATGFKSTSLTRIEAESAHPTASRPAPDRQIAASSKLLQPKKSARSTASAAVCREANNNNCVGNTGSEDPVGEGSKYSVGSVCQVGDKTGTLRYCGQVCFAQGEWCGVELNEPTGKNDGLVKGRRYFSCRDKHGVFVPLAKVNIISGPKSSTHKSVYNKKEANVNISPTGPVSQTDANQNTIVDATEKTSKNVPVCVVTSDKVVTKGSKLLQPKLTGKSKLTKLQAEKPVQPSQASSTKQRVKSGEASAKGVKESKVAQKVQFSTNSTFNVSEESFTQVCDLTYTATDFTESAPQVTFLLPPSANDTFQVETATTGGLSASPAKKAKTEEPELGKQLNRTYVVPDCHETGLCAADTKQADIAPPVKCNDLDLSLDQTRNIMSEPEEADISTSNISHASSLGILCDQELCDDNLLTSVHNTSLENGTHEWLEQLNKCSKWIENEVSEKDLDLEIAGIPTPDQELSSQGSGREEESSPELDVTKTVAHTTLELTFNLKPGQTSTPTSPFKTDCDPDHIQIVKPKLPVKNISEEAAVPEKKSAFARQKALNSTFVVKDGNANELDQTETVSPEKCPKRLKTSSDVDQVGRALNASFELARTAVSQYAELVKGAERERIESLRRRENRRSLIEVHSSGFCRDNPSATHTLSHSFHEDTLRPKSGHSPLHTSDSVNSLKKDYAKHVDVRSTHAEVLHSQQVLDTKKVVLLGQDNIASHQLNKLSTGYIPSKNINSSVQSSNHQDITLSGQAIKSVDEKQDEKHNHIGLDNINLCVEKHNNAPALKESCVCEETVESNPSECGVLIVSRSGGVVGPVCSDQVGPSGEPCTMDSTEGEGTEGDVPCTKDNSRAEDTKNQEPGTMDDTETEDSKVELYQDSNRPTTLSSSVDTAADAQTSVLSNQSSPSLSSDSPTLRELSTSSQLSDSGCHTQAHTDGYPVPSIEVCGVSSSSQKEDTEDTTERGTLDTQSHQTMDLCDQQPNEGWNNNPEAGEQGLTEEGQTGEPTQESEIDHSHIQGQVTGVVEQPDMGESVLVTGEELPEAEGRAEGLYTGQGAGGQLHLSERCGQGGGVAQQEEEGEELDSQNNQTEREQVNRRHNEDLQNDNRGEGEGSLADNMEESQEAGSGCVEDDTQRPDLIQDHTERPEVNGIQEGIQEGACVSGEGIEKPGLSEEHIDKAEVCSTDGDVERLGVSAGEGEHPAGIEESARDREDACSLDTEGTHKAEEEMEMLDMSWDNMMEFTHIKDKSQVNGDHSAEDNLPLVSGVALLTDQLVSEGQSVGEGSGHLAEEDVSEGLVSLDPVLEVMDTECQDSCQSLDTSRDGRASTPEKSAAGKRKTLVRETKSSRLRGSRESPEKEGVGTQTKTGFPKRTAAAIKKPSPPHKPTDTHKPKTAIQSKSKSTLTSHLKKPSTGPATGSANHNPGDAKSSKTETKSLQKRKTDSSASTHPVPSKKAASSAKAGKHSNHNVSQKGDLSSTSKTDLNLSSSSTEAKSRSFDRPPAANRKSMPPPKSKPPHPDRKHPSEQDATAKSQPPKSKLQLPKSSYSKKAATVKDDSNIPASGLSKSNVLRRSTISTVHPSSIPPAPTRPQHTRLLTSTPKTVGTRRSLGLPDSTLLNASLDSSVPSGKPKLSGRPGHRTTMALKKRERSASIGSDSQTSVTSLASTLSNISRVSTQGSANPPRHSKDSGTLDTSLTDGAAPSRPKRRGLKDRENSEPRRVGISVSTDGRSASKAKSSQPLASSSPKKNQSRNGKPVSAPGKVPTGGSTKRSGQASSKQAGGSAQANREEVTRLEALCESRTKELNYARIQYKQSVAGFQAMSVLVKYLTEELGAFSLPEVCSQLEEKERLLCETQVHLSQLTTQRDALIEEIQCIQESCATKLEKMQQEHTESVTCTREQHQSEIQQCSEKHKGDLDAVKASHEQKLAAVRKEHEAHLQERERCHKQATERLQQDSQARIAELTKQHEDALNDITVRFEDIKMTLSEKVEYLRSECDMLRGREKEHMDTFQRDSDMKVQLAIKPFQQLPAEIESLKAVLDMRNDEIHQLRRYRLDLEKQLEALPKAQEHIKVLQHKNENLEAIINIRSDYEKSLTEKNQVLLRKLDRESKANKRLSMENEEFQWRMTEGGISDLLSRSISHSPTSSTASTPEPTRKRRSPHPPHSPRSPRTSGSDFDRQRSPRSSGGLDSADKKGRVRRSNGELHSTRSSCGSDCERLMSPRSGGMGSPDCSLVSPRGGAQDNSLMSLSVHSEPSPSSSPLNRAQQGAGIKRSGTYELLDQEFEDAASDPTPASDSKQTEV